MIKGRTLDQAATISNTQIVEELNLPPVKIHCSVLAEDAIKAAIDDYKKKHDARPAGPPAQADRRAAAPQPAARRNTTREATAHKPAPAVAPSREIALTAAAA